MFSKHFTGFFFSQFPFKKIKHLITYTMLHWKKNHLPSLLYIAEWIHFIIGTCTTLVEKCKILETIVCFGYKRIIWGSIASTRLFPSKRINYEGITKYIFNLLFLFIYIFSIFPFMEIRLFSHIMCHDYTYPFLSFSQFCPISTPFLIQSLCVFHLKRTDFKEIITNMAK